MPAVATAGGLPTRLGKYEILSPLATGGMARIYIARSTGIGSFERHVVLKLITPERENDTTAVQMFLDEARLAASLNHQNVAQVFEVGEDGGIHYLAMEYVHGQDLRALLAKAGSQGTRVPLDLALTTVAGAAAGLNHAHDRRDGNGVPLGIVHRDVSPSNIMIGLDGSVKLLDFGIAKATSRSVETQSGIIKGKFAYMAPEQCRGRDVDRRSDVFSLGIILYEITTQHRCFRADSDFDTMHRIVTGDVVRPTRLVQGYPQPLEAIVLKALAIDANQRYQSAGLLLEAIEAFAMSARMSLSTMALGRFMREMFGETPEPWLTQAGRSGASLPLQPKESTISNTNASQEGSPRPASSSAPEMQAAHTLLDLPRGHEHHDDDHRHDEPNAAEWNAKSYPQMQPSYASAQTLPPPDSVVKPGRTSSPGMVALPAPRPSGTIPPPISSPMGSQPLVLPASTQFPAQPGSESGPSHKIPSTRTGFANGPGMSQAISQSAVAYPRYEPDSADADLRLRPNRRPLYIGIAIVLAGIAVVIIVGLGGSSIETAPPAKPVETVPAVKDPEPAPVKEPIQEPTPVPVKEVAPPIITIDAAVEIIEESIRINVRSTPPGANVLLAGKPIGTTPFETNLPRGTGAAQLTVQRAGYEEITTKIDLSAAEFSKDVTLTKLPEKKPAEVKKPVERKQPEVKKPVERKQDKPEKKTTPPPEKKPACQPPSAIDPFDPRPVCKS
ncbi:MAG: protein kinase [Kofleriaceae bacterium]